MPVVDADPVLPGLAEVCAAAGSWPLPGGGQTLRRWQGLAALAGRDLVLARLAEAHADAVAITAELGAPLPRPGQRWGVWAAEAPGGALEWRSGVLVGTKQWCSGATLLTHALVTTIGSAGQRQLCAVDLSHPGVRPGPLRWAWSGMREADTRAVTFDGVPAQPVGPPGGYLARPGFWLGALGVAACWFGGAAAVGSRLAAAVRDNGLRTGGGRDALAAAQLGRVEVLVAGAGDSLRAAAGLVDGDPRGEHRRLARRVRSTVAQAASDVAALVGRALGPGPYALDAQHARRVADLELYVRQDHGESDLCALGGDVAGSDAAGWAL